jgi:hypothetical protein
MKPPLLKSGGVVASATGHALTIERVRKGSADHDVSLGQSTVQQRQQITMLMMRTIACLRKVAPLKPSV